MNGWNEVDDAVAFFVDDFLCASVRKGGPFKKQTWHVVFSFGSCVRFDMPEERAPGGWRFRPEDFDDDYPKHRIAGGRKALAEIYAENRAHYKAAVLAQPTLRAVIRAAYHHLMT